MSMDKDILGAAIAARLMPPDASESTKAVSVEIWTKVADEVIRHIEENATGILSFNVTVDRTGRGMATPGNPA